MDEAEPGISGGKRNRGRKIGFHAPGGDCPEGKVVGLPKGQRRGDLPEIERTLQGRRGRDGTVSRPERKILLDVDLIPLQVPRRNQRGAIRE